MLWGPFPSCFLWVHQSVTTTQMVHLLMWSAGFWLGLVPQPFHKHLAANGVKPLCLPVSVTQTGRAQQHPHGLTALNTPHRLQLDTLQRGTLLWGGLQDKGARRGSGRQQFWCCFHTVTFSSCPHPVLTTPFKSRQKSLLLAFGLCNFHELGVYPKCSMSCLAILPPTLLPLAEREAIDKNTMDLQLPARQKWGQ